MTTSKICHQNDLGSEHGEKQPTLAYLTSQIRTDPISDFPDGFPDGLVGKECACNAGDTGDIGSIPGSGGSPGVGNGNPLQYSCLENPMDRGAWRAIAHGVPKSQIQLRD